MKLHLGISSCLLGQAVRYDGGHKHDRFITQTLGQVFDFMPICPEVAIGLPTPRPPIRLFGDKHSTRVVGVKDNTLDVTEQLTQFGEKKAKELSLISGYIFKKDSPSCGMQRVKRYQADNQPPQRDGVGLYAKALMQQNPLLPCEEEGRLCDPVLRENFIERIFVYNRLKELLTGDKKPADLVNFHSQHKYAIMAHNQNALKELGRLVANEHALPFYSQLQQYANLLMHVLKQPATTKNHTNVLQHLQGYLKRDLSPSDKVELSDAIKQYNQGLLPLLVPLTLLKHHFRRHPDPYILEQTYLNPHPKELKLRNWL